MTAIVLTSLMVAFALASLSIVDAQTQRSREQRERETSLNIAESALYTHGFVLAQAWPGNAAAGAAMPALCSSEAVTSMCPDPNTLAAANSSSPAAANFTSVDASANVAWTTRIRDNGGPLADAFHFAAVDAAQSGAHATTGGPYTCPGPCRWDANGDLKLWVQARAVVRGQIRNVVALLKREEFSEAFASSAVTAGSFETTNRGNKTIIDASGSQVAVRCLGTTATCTDYDERKSQVLPATIIRDATTPDAMTSAQIERFEAAAKSVSPPTYHTSCPASLSGRIVFIDVPSTTHCTDTNRATYNSAAEPGIVIMPRGTLTLQGTLHGLVYMANEQASTGAVLTLEANSEVLGGVAIDGPGRLVAGQSSGDRPTVTYVANAFSSLATFGTTGLVQNTWRELPAS